MMQPQRVVSTGQSALVELQLSVIQSALTGAPLPGGAATISYPDRAYFEKGGQYLLLGDNVSHAAPPPIAAKPIAVLSEAEVLERAIVEGELAALHFLPPVVNDNEILLVLEGRVYRADGSWAPLSSTQVRFHRRGGEWVAEPPAYLSG